MVIRTRLVLVFILCACIHAANAQNDEAMIYLFGGEHTEQGRQIISSGAGGFAMVGTTGGFQGSNTDVYVLRLDEDLNCVWNRVIGGSQIEWGEGIVEDEEGNFIICGYTNASSLGGYDASVYKLNPQGEILWQHTYGGEDWDFASKIIPHPDGGYLVCGRSYSFGNGSSDGYLIHLSVDGELISEWTYGGAGEDGFTDVDVFENKILLSGYQASNEDSAKHRNILCIGFDGIVVWQSVLGDAGVYSYYSSAVVFGEYIYECGNYMAENGYLQTLFGAYRLIDGSQFWQTLEVQNGDFVSNDISVDTDQIILSGYTNAIGDGNDNGFIMTRDIYGGYTGAISIGSERLEMHNHIIHNGKFVASAEALHSANALSVQAGVFVYPDLSFSSNSTTSWSSSDCFALYLPKDLAPLAITHSFDLYDLTGKLIGNFPIAALKMKSMEFVNQALVIVFKDQNNSMLKSEIRFFN